VIGHIADVGTAATFSRTTDALEAIRDRGDVEWITATTTALNAQGKLDVNAECDSALSDYGANTTVPDAAGTAATLHGTTDGLVTTVDTVCDTIAIDVAGLNGDVMRGTDGVSLVVPDIAGTAAGLHTTTDTHITDVKGTGFVKDTDSMPQCLTATSVTVSDKTGFSLSNAGVDAILDEVIEGTHTLRQYMRTFASVLIGKVTGGGTDTIVYRDVPDSKDRVTTTVTEDGNRTAITLVED
jgi:hypothetical protein